MDKETGLIYMKARFYDPVTGRFLNQDPFEGQADLPPSLHKYLYAFGNPTVYIDPDGRFAFAQEWMQSMDRAADRVVTWGAQVNLGDNHFANQLEQKIAKSAGSVAGGIDVVNNAVGLLNYIGNNVSVASDKSAQLIGLDGGWSRSHSDEIGEDVGEAITGLNYLWQNKAKVAKSMVINQVGMEVKAMMGDKQAIAESSRQKTAIAAEVLIGKGTSKLGALSKLDNLPGVNSSKRSKGSTNTESHSGVGTGGCPCPLCFAAGTPIITQEGLKAIEEVAIGELVASKDPDSGEVTWKPVTHLWEINDDRITYELTLVSPSGDKERYEVTDNHPFWVEGQGWVDAIELQAGMQIPSFDGELLSVEGIEPLHRSPTTYNFEVQDFHTYFVGELGAWVHNCNCGVDGANRNTFDISEVPIVSLRDAKQLPGSNRGLIFVQENLGTPRNANGQFARDFESGTVGAFSDVASQKRAAPALRFDNPNPNGNNFVKLDGFELDADGVSLVDAKTRLLTFQSRGSEMVPQSGDLRRLSEALRQNPDYKGVLEFPDNAARNDARRILRELQISNIQTRVRTE